VLSRTFLGEKAEYRVGLGDQVLQVTQYTRPHGSQFHPGDAVGVMLPSEGVPILTG